MHDRELCSLFLTLWKLLSQDSESHVQICYLRSVPAERLHFPIHRIILKKPKIGSALLNIAYYQARYYAVLLYISYS